MELKHLSDEEIQDYLDGNSGDKSNDVKAHLHICKICQRAFHHYGELARVLASAPEIRLSGDFARMVREKVETHAIERRMFRFSNLILWIAGALACAGAIIHYSNLNMLANGLKDFSGQGKNIVQILITAFRGLFAGTNMKLSFFALAILVLIGIALIDRVIIWMRRNPTPKGFLFI